MAGQQVLSYQHRSPRSLQAGSQLLCTFTDTTGQRSATEPQCFLHFSCWHPRTHPPVVKSSQSSSASPSEALLPPPPHTSPALPFRLARRRLEGGRHTPAAVPSRPALPAWQDASKVWSLQGAIMLYEPMVTGERRRSLAASLAHAVAPASITCAAA